MKTSYRVNSKPVNSQSVGSEAVTAGLAYARRFQELVVYKKARSLARDIFNASKPFPKEERYALTDQLRRASRSVGAQIAEAWSQRRYEKHFASKLTDADGEQLETQHWLTVAFDCGYLNRNETRRLGGLCLEIGRMLGEMIAKAEEFCQATEPVLRETTVDYVFTRDGCFLTDD